MQCLPDNDVNSCGSSCTPCRAASGGVAACSPVGTTGTFACACASGSALCGTTCVPTVQAQCSSSGTCADATGVPLCTCTTGYTGPTCSSCAAGYQDNDTNGTCAPTCATRFPGVACSGNGTCSDTSGTASCTCSPGWHGFDCSLSNFVRVAVGGLHTCGVRANGTVECWGHNNVNQTAVPAGLLATDVTAGTWWSCALPTTGGVTCWGDALGLSSSPMNNAANKPTSGTFLNLASDPSSTWACALAPTGLATCFGPNRATNSQAGTGQFAVGQALNQYAIITTGGSLGAQAVPGTIPTNPSGYGFLDCGLNYCCAVRETRQTQADRLQGGVQCWGASGLSAVTSAPALTSPYAALSAGETTVCGIRSTPTVPSTDLRLTCWGTSSSGLITARPTDPVVDVSVGRNHACAVALTGEVRCWGTNSFGEAPSVRP
jgi:hypothetical protein